MLQEIVEAARTYDRPRAEEAVRELTEAVPAGQQFDERPLSDALKELRNNRWFDLLRAAGDELIQSGDTRPAIRKLYAQSLIDTGVLSAAVPFLERLIAESTGFERDEARGLLGRAWKQAYVTDENATEPLARLLMERSIEQYYTPYVENAENLWHAVNTVAMIARAKRDGVRVSGRYPDYRKLARTIRDAAKARCRDAWDYAIASEACVALGQWEGALEFLQQYLADPTVTAFAAGGTLRQFVEVWRLSGTGDGEGGPLVHLLEAEMLKKEGGQEIDVSRAHAAVRALDAESDMLQAVLGDEKYKTLEWYRTGLARASGVARIGFQSSLGQGTGFLVHFGKEQLLVTNHHVVPARISNLEQAVVTFESLDGGRKKYKIKEQLWTSPIPELDATIVRLDREVKGVEPYPLSSALPDLKSHPRVYVIGHPHGGTMTFSLADNLLIDLLAPKLHYRAPTDPGSSGSPVFDANWSLLALHHAGARNMPKLRGEGTHPANEGLAFNAIAEEFEKARLARPAKRPRKRKAG